MEMAYMLFQELIVLLLIGGIGFAIVRLGVLKEEDCKPLSSLVLYVFTPCAIIKSFQLPIDDQHVHGLALAIGFAVAVNLIWIFVNFLLKKKVPLTSVDELTLMYTNSGNLVYPLVAMIFGKEYLFYAAPYNAVMTCFVWTHGKAIIQESSNLDLKRVIKNVNILSIIIGIVLFFLQIKLPVLIETTMDLLGSMLGPASMIVIGMIMAGTDLKKVFYDGQALCGLYGASDCLSADYHFAPGPDGLYQGTSGRHFYFSDCHDCRDGTACKHYRSVCCHV